jgi:hypothetical protein
MKAEELKKAAEILKKKLCFGFLHIEKENDNDKLKQRSKSRKVQQGQRRP